MKIGFCLGEFYKRCEFSIIICELLASKYSIHVDIMGPYDEEILQKLKKANCDRVVFKSNMDFKEIKRYYHDIDILLFPSEICSAPTAT